VVNKLLLTRSQISLIHRELTVRPTFNPFSPSDPFLVYFEDDEYFYLPRYWAEERLGRAKATQLPDGNEAQIEVAQGLLPHQTPAWAALEQRFDPNSASGSGGILSLPCGYGKCLGLGTQVMLWPQGQIAVEDIRPGFKLMGPDQQPREVITLARGREMMAQIIPQDPSGHLQPWSCNLSHLLTLYCLSSQTIQEHSVQEWLSWSVTQQQRYRLIQVSLPGFTTQEALEISPSLLDLPRPRSERASLAFKLSPNRPKTGWWVKAQYAQLYRDLGYYTTRTLVQDQVWVWGRPELFRLYSFQVQVTGPGNYYGFTLNRDKRFLLADRVVTHNTFLAIRLAARLRGQTLIVVHKDFLVKQWISSIRRFSPSSKIGLIKADKVEIKDKDFVIGMLQSLSKRDYGPVFNGFRFVIIDEVHHIGAEKFSQALPVIFSKFTLGLSATPWRKDGTSPVFFHYLGPLFYQEKRQGDQRVRVLAPRLSWPGHPAYQTKYQKVNNRSMIATGRMQ